MRCSFSSLHHFISTRRMSTFELTAAQRDLLRNLPEAVELARLDRLWIFSPHIGTNRESGLFALSLVSDSTTGGEMRELITVSYTLEQQNSRKAPDRTILPEGWAPPERIERVIAGVLARSGEEAGEPREITLQAGEDWNNLLGRLGVTG